MSSVINILTVIQARTTSTRLPNKVLMPLAGKTVLLRLVERVKLSKLTGEVVVATSHNDSDDPIEEMCKRENIRCFRGHPTDLLDRHYRAGLKYDADSVIKIPSDCPLIDPQVIDRIIKFYLNNQEQYDYFSNLHPASYPDGNDVEIIPMKILRIAHSEARKDFEREHTTPYIWENPARFRIGNVVWESGFDYSMTHRWTLDYEEDYEFIYKVFEELYPVNPQFGIYDILNLLERKPEIEEINKKFIGVNWYRNHFNDLKTVTAEQTRFL